jgi:hypothetical protein
MQASITAQCNALQRGTLTYFVVHYSVVSRYKRLPHCLCPVYSLVRSSRGRATLGPNRIYSRTIISKSTRVFGDNSVWVIEDEGMPFLGIFCRYQSSTHVAARFRIWSAAIWDLQGVKNAQSSFVDGLWIGEGYNWRTKRIRNKYKDYCEPG